jgi:hypothetical protein
MGNRTERFGFTTFDNEQDNLAAENFKAFGSDRINLDRLLWVAAETHRHNGEQLTELVPPPPVLDIDITGGALPPNTAIFYRISLVDPSGQEHLASQIASLVTPVQSPTPAAPQMSAGGNNGFLGPGDYQYGVSAYVGDTFHETPLSETVSGSLRVGHFGWAITFPRLPSGATGFNLYRKGPTESSLNYLLSVTSEGSTVYDDGAIDLSRARYSPAANTTATTNIVRLDLEEALPTWWTVKVYRTFDSSNWDRTLIGWTSELPFTDVGAQPEVGYPPDTSAGVGGAPKIRLGTDTTGTLPPGLVSTTQVATFNVRGSLESGAGHWQWVNDFDNFVPTTARANLGVGSSPAEQSVIVTIEYRWAGTTEWLRFETPGGEYGLAIEIPIGDNASYRNEIASFMNPLPVFHPGDALRVVILQAGGGATPTDRDLTVGLAGLTRHGGTDTPTWSTP